MFRFLRYVCLSPKSSSARNELDFFRPVLENHRLESLCKAVGRGAFTPPAARRRSRLPDGFESNASLIRQEWVRDAVSRCIYARTQWRSSFFRLPSKPLISEALAATTGSFASVRPPCSTRT